MSRPTRCTHPHVALVNPRQQVDSDAGPVTVYDCTQCGSTGAWWPRSLGGDLAVRIPQHAQVPNA